MPVLYISLLRQRTEDAIRGGAVVGDRDIVDLRDAKQRLDVGVVRHRGQGVGEENDDIDLPARDLRADLLVSAKRAAEVGAHGQPRRLVDLGGGGSRPAQEVMRQDLLILLTPFDDGGLHIVVRDQRDAFGHCGLTPFSFHPQYTISRAELQDFSSYALHIYVHSRIFNGFCLHF